MSTLTKKNTEVANPTPNVEKPSAPQSKTPTAPANTL